MPLHALHSCRSLEQCLEHMRTLVSWWIERRVQLDKGGPRVHVILVTLPQTATASIKFVPHRWPLRLVEAALLPSHRPGRCCARTSEGCARDKHREAFEPHWLPRNQHNSTQQVEHDQNNLNTSSNTTRTRTTCNNRTTTGPQRDHNGTTAGQQRDTNERTAGPQRDNSNSGTTGGQQRNETIPRLDVKN